MPNNISTVFFGTSRFSVIALDELKKLGLIPQLIVTTPDKPQGKKLVVTSPPVKVWAEENNIPILQPEKLKDNGLVERLKEINAEVFVVASYGKIIPKEIITIPKHGTLNIHPSLLPKYRGASPLQTAILNDDAETGVTIIKLDEEMDHGPIIAQEFVDIPDWPVTYTALEETLAKAGAQILFETLPEYISGSIAEQEQEHSFATFTKKIEKQDGLINLEEDSYNNYLKYLAFSEWPGVYFFIKKNDKEMRVVIKKARYNEPENKLEIETVIPEGKQEMDFNDFKKGYLS
jgi:methionyl-tRNA formyltransferase